MNPVPSYRNLRKTILRPILILLTLALLAALCGCGVEPVPQTEVTTVPAVTSTTAPRPAPAAGPDRLEADGKEIGPIYLLDGAQYLDAGALATRLSLTMSEPEKGVLRWFRADDSVSFLDGSDEAESSGGLKYSLSAPALEGEAGWYLPLSVFEEILPRTSAYDGEEGVLRCFRPEPGPGLRWNGTDCGESALVCGTPVIPAELFCDLTGAEAEESEEIGLKLLTLNLPEHTLTLRAGSRKAELDGEAIEFAVPVYTDGETWYMPVEALEALGCVTIPDTENDVLELWQVTEGPMLWLDGTGLGRSLLCGETPCVPLPAAAEALGGTLTARGNGVALTVGEHVLVFQTASQSWFSDGEALTLPIPVLPYRQELLLPVEPLAEALDIPRLEGEDLIFSRTEPRDTVIFADGREAKSFVCGGETLYLRLNDVCLPEENPPEIWINSAEFNAFGKRLLLTGGSELLEIDGEDTSLSAPVRADGENWYVPSELLSVLGLSEFRDPELDQIYYTHIVRHEDLAEGYRVPVLMYHAVSDDIWGIPELFISPSTLEKQLQAIVDGGYTAITFEDLDRIDEIEKPVMLTFDDGYDDNYKYLFPLLKQYNVKATVFVIVNDLGKSHKLTKAQVEEMSDSGLVSIQSHTMSHNYLDGMYETQLIKEHYNSMVELARITGKQPFVMCYPTGKSSGYSREVTARYYEYGLCMGGPCWVTGDAPYRIYRYYIPRKTSLETFLSYLEG